MAATITLAQAEDWRLAFNDHEAFCRESLSIRDLGGSIVPFHLTPGQQKLAEAKREMQKRNKPVRLCILKTRRSTFTSGCCAEMFHDVPFLAGRKGLIIADNYKPAGKEAFDYLLQFQRGYKPLTRHGKGLRLPALIKDSQQEIGWANNASIEVLSAEKGEIRGGGRHWVLCDEVAFWRVAELTLTGVLNMVPKLPETVVVVQSTANGIGGDFYELWQRASDAASQSGWYPLFFGWLEYPQVYSAPFESPAAKSKFAEKLDREERDLHQMHGATLEQLHWRREKIATEFRGNIDLFHQEYPTTPEEAFLASGRPVFDHKALMRMPVAQGTAGELEVREDGPIKRLAFNIGEHGALTIWKKPEPGHRYVMGADPSKGVDVSAAKRGDDPDFSVGFLIDADTGDQVALLRARIRPVAFAEYLALVGKWYNWALLVPEANDAGFIDALVRTGYPLEWVYQRQRDPTDRRPSRIEEIGFETTSLTREWLVAAAEDAIRNVTITIRSSVVIQECVRFVIKPNGKKEHQDGAHDDCVLAMALTEIGRRAMPKRMKPGQDGAAKLTRYGRFGKARDEDDD